MEGDVGNLRLVVKNVSWAVGRTIEKNGGWDPRPGSQFVREIAEQGPFVGRNKTPVANAYSVALVRHVSAMKHFEDLARLLVDESTAYGPASLTRTALENSAWAWWAFDPSIDVKQRIARGLSAQIESLNEVVRLPYPPLQEEARSKRDDIAADAEAHGFHVQRKEKDGSPMWVEEKPPRITTLLVTQLGDGAKVSYSDLSAVAHGTLFGIMSRMEDTGVPLATEGVTLMQPSAPLESLTLAIAHALESFWEATDRRFLLYGWDVTHWKGWVRECRRLILPLLHRASHVSEGGG